MLDRLKGPEQMDSDTLDWLTTLSKKIDQFAEGKSGEGTA